LLAAVAEISGARAVPLPQPRPQLPAAATPELSVEAPAKPSACRLRLTADVAVAPSLTPITGPGECEAPDVVLLEAVVLSDKRRVGIEPPAIVRCTMAEALASWVREEAAPRTLALGSPLKSVENLAAFECRGRNGSVGGKLSEHGKANAIDLHSLRLANGKVLELIDPHVPKDFREGLRQSVCARFTTVLGPGSDGFHEDHIHIDLIERRSNYRICQWDVLEPGEKPAAASGETVPMPPPRPPIGPVNERSQRRARR
jgi:hypothetical protein